MKTVSLGWLLVTMCMLAACCAPAARSNSPPTQGDAPPPASPPAYEWRLPLGFPVPRVPADNPMTSAKVELGRHLFYDRALSGNGTYSCASCHRQALAFTDGRTRALGSTGEIHPRSAMSLANVAYSVTLTWADPTLNRLEDQMLTPMFNLEPVELGLAGQEAALLERIESSTGYPPMFAAAFPENSDPITLLNLRRAIASFERTLLSGSAPYDRLVYRGDSGALSESALRGMRLFFSDRLNCSRCHGGFTFSGPVAFEELEPIAPTFHNTGLYNLGGTGRYPEDNTGLFGFTRKEEDMGRFRAPTLRNVELTAPYMHDGSIATLSEVLTHYASGGRTLAEGPEAGVGRENPHKSDLIRGFDLDESQQSDLIEFLKSLTDRSFVTDPRFSDPGSTATLHQP
ncbi:MAG: di-heme enzyme [Acidobacteria bacterium]|nr:di-heme enzyme [Acidobacteriota bacterium]